MSQSGRQLALKGTFIDELAEPSTERMQRSWSDSRLASMHPADSAFALEQMYISLLPERAANLVRMRGGSQSIVAAEETSVVVLPLEQRLISNGFEAGMVPQASPMRILGLCCNPGSYGHPILCVRPCLQFALGSCTRGVKCPYCHLEHTENPRSLGKRERDSLRNMSFGQRVAVVLPVLRKMAEEQGFSKQATAILVTLAAHEENTGPLAGKTRSRLSKSLSGLNFGSILLHVCDGVDTPPHLPNLLHKLAA